MINISRLLILSCLILSCSIMSCDKNEDEDNNILPVLSCGQGLLTFNSVEYDSLLTDSTAVIDIRLDQTCLIIDFAYSGCDERDIDVMAFLDESSDMPILNAKIRNGPFDECLAFFTHTDTFDLTSTQIDLYDGIILNVHQWDELFVLEVE